MSEQQILAQEHRKFTAELLERNHRFIKLRVIIHYHLLAIPFTNNQTGITPTEVVHAPKRVDWQEEAVHRISDKMVNSNVMTVRADAHDRI
jgi:hypothetical protein